MKLKINITNSLIVLALALITSLILTTVNTPGVVADHTVEHCEEVFGASGNTAYEDCVAQIGRIGGGGERNPGGALILEPVNNEALGETYDCNGVQISINVECTSGENPILSYLGGIINFLAAGVGVVVVAMVTMSGVQYITSHGDPQKVAAAKSRLVNAMIGLISFIFLYAFLQWLIPGGLFSGGSSQEPCTTEVCPR